MSARGSIFDVKMVCSRCGGIFRLGDCEPCIAPDGSEGTGFGCPAPDCGGIMEAWRLGAEPSGGIGRRR